MKKNKNHIGIDISKLSFDVTIKKCLWHTSCVENDCANLCRLFCDVDDITYGGLKKIEFKRTTTLGYGGNCCDFCFYKKELYRAQINISFLYADNKCYKINNNTFGYLS